MQAHITGGAAEFILHSVGKTAAAAQALTGTGTTAGAELLSGSYQLTAAFSGDSLYGMASGSLDVGVTCPIVSLTA